MCQYHIVLYDVSSFTYEWCTIIVSENNTKYQLGQTIFVASMILISPK